MIERSVPVEEIERQARRAVPRLEIEDLERPPRLRAEPVDGDRLRVYRPEPSTGGAAGTRTETGRTATREGEKQGDDTDRGASRTRPPKPSPGQ